MRRREEEEKRSKKGSYVQVGRLAG